MPHGLSNFSARAACIELILLARMRPVNSAQHISVDSSTKRDREPVRGLIGPILFTQTFALLLILLPACPSNFLSTVHPRFAHAPRRRRDCVADDEKRRDRLVEARVDSDARWIVLRGPLLYIRLGVYVGRCEGDRQF